jgi:hypothetical protein
MHKYRIALIVSGALLACFGAFRLLTQLDHSDLVALVVWLVVAVVLHDLVIAPATVGTGVLLTRVPPRARRYVQAALIAGAMVTVIAIPLIAREGTQPSVKATLQRNYVANLALLLGLVIAMAVILYLFRAWRSSPTRHPPLQPDDS